MGFGCAVHANFFCILVLHCNFAHPLEVVDEQGDVTGLHKEARTCLIRLCVRLSLCSSSLILSRLSMAFAMSHCFFLVERFGVQVHNMRDPPGYCMLSRRLFIIFFFILP